MSIDIWHSPHTLFHHFHTSCRTCQFVPIEERLPGTGGKPRCSECERLARPHRRFKL